MDREQITALEQQLDDLAQTLFRSHAQLIVPNPPWVLVRVLPRHQSWGSGILVMPDDKQKPTHEAIVLRTWEPFRVGHYGHRDKNNVYSKLRPDLPGEWDGQLLESELKPGDHVMFPHWAGLPVPGYDETKYRLVKELGWKQHEEGGIFAVLEYEEKDAQLTQLRDAILAGADLRPRDVGDAVAQAVMKRFILVDKAKASKTISSTKQE